MARRDRLPALGTSSLSCVGGGLYARGVTRALVVDDDSLVRRLLTSILTSQGIDVVGEAADGDEVIDAVNARHPDVVLMDLHMARVGGLAAIAELQRRPNPPAVIALTSFGNDDTVLAALRAGAKGFLAKDADPHHIADAVERVAAGEGALDPASAGAAIRHLAHAFDDQRQVRAHDALAALTDREREVAALVPSGLSNAEIGAQTYCSESTVKAHLSRAMAKLGIASRTQLAVLVDRAGNPTDTIGA
ncbi:DNA-binding response regulator (plasmid) [Cellulomonas sp. WB94]|nr:DNA-binding response regulator [Cellulomonas sp. WB94]